MSSSLYGYASGYKKSKPRPSTNRQVSGYNPAAYVPGGSSKKVATAIQSKGGQRPTAYKPPRAAPAPQPRAPAPPPQPAAQASADPYTFDYDQDPVLQRIQSLGVRGRAGAQAEATEAKKQLAIDYGDADLARQLGDENTATAAANNPLGVRQQLKHKYDENVTDFEQDLPSSLFYSGYRGKELGNLATGYQEGLAGAGRQQQGLLSGIDRGLVEALMGYDRDDADAEGEAAQRAIDAGLGGAPSEEADFNQGVGISDLLGEDIDPATGRPRLRRNPIFGHMEAI